MLLNQFILRFFQLIGGADALADISRRDTRSPPFSGSIVWLGARVVGRC